MKKYLVGLSVLLIAGMGCGSEDTPLTPGDPDDADFQQFSQQFDAMDEGVGLMAEMAFSVIDDVMTPAAPGVAGLSAEFALENIWDEATSSWIGTLTYEDAEMGLSFYAQHTVQFFHGTTPVQFPDEEQLTEIQTALAMEASGQGMEINASQELKITPPEGDDIVHLTGSGEFHASLVTEQVTETGTTSCTFQSDFQTTISNVGIFTGEIPPACDNPLGGSVRFSGAVAGECTGEFAASFSKAWTVSRTWTDTGDAVTEFVSGGNIWTIEEPCLQ